MTTSTQQQVLSESELACLKAISDGAQQSADEPHVAGLIAKGMLVPDDSKPRGPAGVALTPAGRHAINVTGPGSVPGIDT